MDKVIYSLLVLLAYATPVYESETSPSKIINCQGSIESCRPSKERKQCADGP